MTSLTISRVWCEALEKDSVHPHHSFIWSLVSKVGWGSSGTHVDGARSVLYHWFSGVTWCYPVDYNILIVVCQSKEGYVEWSITHYIYHFELFYFNKINYSSTIICAYISYHGRLFVYIYGMNIETKTTTINNASMKLIQSF